MATLLLMALPVVGEEKSILDGAEVICSLGTCRDSWYSPAIDALISNGFRQYVETDYDFGYDRELMIDLKQSQVVKTVYLSHYIDDWDYESIYCVGSTYIYIGDDSASRST